MARTPTFLTNVQKTETVNRETLARRARDLGMTIQGYIAFLIESDMASERPLINHTAIRSRHEHIEEAS